MGRKSRLKRDDPERGRRVAAVNRRRWVKGRLKAWIRDPLRWVGYHERATEARALMEKSLV